MSSEDKIVSTDHISDITTADIDVTHWRHVRFEGPDTPWITRKEHGRGYVAYARRAYRAGERICTEFPTVWIHGHHPFNAAQIEEIEEKVASLDEEDKTAFFAMANVFPEFPPAVGIFMTNCFDMTDSIYGTCCAMYLALARLNHSCYPNAQQTHIPTTTEEVLYAARDIAEGEEINDCYIDLRQSRHNRRQELQEYYRFYCVCAACSQEDDILVDQEDSLRIRTSEISDRIISLIAGEDDSMDEKRSCITALSTALQLKNDLLNPPTAESGSPVRQGETSERWCVRYLPELYITIHQLCDSLAGEHSNKSSKTNKNMAQRFQQESLAYLQQAFALTAQLQGPSSPEYQRLHDLLQEYSQTLAVSMPGGSEKAVKKKKKSNK